MRHAAGLGMLEVLETLLAGLPDPGQLEEALAFACVRGEVESVRALLRAGARGDVLVTHGGRSACTALHEAAGRGHREIVLAMLAAGANPTVVEPCWGGTPAGWAAHSGHPALAALLREHAARG
jgi:ankyrin repeat protein